MKRERKDSVGRAIFTSIRDAFDDFILDMESRGFRHGTITNYRSRVGAFVRWCEENGVNEIDANTIRRFRKLIIDSGVGERAIFNSARDVRAFLNWCKYEGLVDDVPVLQMPPEPAPEPNPYSQDEITAIVDACNNDRERVIVYLLLATGIRPGELELAQTEHFDLRERTLYIPVGKMRKPRTVVFDEETRRMIRTYARSYGIDMNAPGPFIISGRGGNLTYSGYRQLFIQLSKRAKFNVTMYRFRDTFATRSITSGEWDVLGLQKAMGHANLQSMKHYVSYTTQDLKKANDRYSTVKDMITKKKKR